MLLNFTQLNFTTSVFQDAMIAKPVRNVAGWYCFQMQDLTLHILTPKLREKYQLEVLWGIDEKASFEADEDVSL